MDSDEKLMKEICEYWNNRAVLCSEAGTQDLIAKQLEIEAIAKFITDGMRVLDAGCGNGITAIELASRYDIDLMGIDVAKKMVEAAQELSGTKTLKGTVRFKVGNVSSLTDLTGLFDVIYTERVLINLPDWNQQKHAMNNIFRLLHKGGLYVMCENSQDGLDEINILRHNIGLSEIKPPWHNRYFRDDEIDKAVFPGVKLDDVIYYASTYYFLSRVVNAWLAAQEAKEPQYNAPINQLALQLPPLGKFGQGRIWLWRKEA